MPQRRFRTTLRLFAQNAALLAKYTALLAKFTALLAPTLLLLSIAATRLSSAFAVERAYPVPAYVSTNVQIPHEATRAAALALAGASAADGETQIARAETLLLSGDSVAGLVARTRQALAHDPASANGWTLLAQLEERSDPTAAGNALALSLELAPYDYWLAGRRATIGAQLWPHLTEGTRQSVVRQVKLLWAEPSLRAAIRPVLDQPHGAELVGRAFQGEPGELRALNREILRERFEENASGSQP